MSAFFTFLLSKERDNNNKHQHVLYPMVINKTMELMFASGKATQLSLVCTCVHMCNTSPLTFSNLDMDIRELCLGCVNGRSVGFGRINISIWRGGHFLWGRRRDN